MYGALATPVVIVAYIAFKISQQPPPPTTVVPGGVSLATVQALIAQAIANLKAQLEKELATAITQAIAGLKFGGLSLATIDLEITNLATTIAQNIVNTAIAGIISGGTSLAQIDLEIANYLEKIGLAGITATVQSVIQEVASLQNQLTSLSKQLVTFPSWLSQDAATTLLNLLNTGPPALLAFSKDPAGYISGVAVNIGIVFKNDVNRIISFINTNIIGTINNVINSIPAIPHPQLPTIPMI